jgi:hypothetical protein
MLTIAVLASAGAVRAEEKAVSASDAGAACGEHRLTSSLAGSSSRKFKIFQPYQWTPEEEAKQKEMQDTLTEMRDETWDDRYRH